MARCALQHDGAARRFVAAARLHADIAVLDQVEAADAVLAAERGSARSSTLAGVMRLPLMATMSPVSYSSSRYSALVRRVLRATPSSATSSSSASALGFSRPGPRTRCAAGWRPSSTARRRSCASCRSRCRASSAYSSSFSRDSQIPFAPRRDDLDVRLRARRRPARSAPGRCPCRWRRARWRRRRFRARSRSGAWRSAAARSRCPAGIRLRRWYWRGTSGTRSRARIPRAGRRCRDFRLTPNLRRLGARRLELFALADVGGEGDDFAVVVILQPFQDDRGVEAARIGEDYFFNVAHAVSKFG